MTQPGKDDSTQAFKPLEMKVGQVFPCEGSAVKSMDFHEAGRMLVIACEDRSITVINAVEGKIHKKIFCRQNGVRDVRFTHDENCVLVTSERDNIIRYISMYDDAILKAFRGHSGTVTTIAMNPLDDKFISASADGSVRIWSLSEQDTALARLQLPPSAGLPNVAWWGTDSNDNLFAVSLREGDDHVIKMYALSSYNLGPFDTYRFSAKSITEKLLKHHPSMSEEAAKAMGHAKWTSIAFNVEGNMILVTTDMSLVMLVDVFEEGQDYNTVLKVMTGHVNDGKTAIDACLSADGCWVLTGSEDGHVCIYDVDPNTEEGQAPSTGRLRGAKKAHEASGKAVRCVACSPRFAVYASACSTCALWINPP